MLDGFLGGILSGLAVAGLLSLAKRLWTNVINPRLRANRTNAHNLDDTTWNVFRNGEQIARLRLEQNGDRLKGKIEFTNGRDRQFKYEGIIRGDMIRLDWTEIQLERLNFGSLNLKLNADGDLMTGYTTFVHRDRAEVVSQYREFQKV